MKVYLFITLFTLSLSTVYAKYEVTNAKGTNGMTLIIQCTNHEQGPQQSVKFNCYKEVEDRWASPDCYEAAHNAAKRLCGANKYSLKRGGGGFTPAPVRNLKEDGRNQAAPSNSLHPTNTHQGFRP